MHKRFRGLVVVAALLAFARVPAFAADEYAIDPVHSGVNFKISHMGLSSVSGRFNDYSGTFAIDADDPGKCSFEMTIKTESVDTNNKKRDDHLRSPDFFNAKQFPGITFKSTSVKQAKDGYEVTGELTLHGVTKTITINLVGGKKAEFPKGVQRTGYSGEVTIKRSDFSMDKFVGMLGDEVPVTVSFEGSKK
jgi:polyisoprenoid-binding protein YceI